MRSVFKYTYYVPRSGSEQQHLTKSMSFAESWQLQMEWVCFAKSFATMTSSALREPLKEVRSLVGVHGILNQLDGDPSICINGNQFNCSESNYHHQRKVYDSQDSGCHPGNPSYMAVMKSL